MTPRQLIAPLAVVFLAGCSFVRFLHPLFEPRDRIVDPGLLGSWHSTGSRDSVTLVVTRGKDSQYDLRAEGEDEALSYTFAMGRVGAQLFWDLVPMPASDEQAFLTPHQFAKVEWADDELLVRMLNEPWFVRQILSGSLTVPYDTVLRNGESDTTYVILARSGELKRIMGIIAADSAAFGEPTRFRRSPAGTP